MRSRLLVVLAQVFVFCAIWLGPAWSGDVQPDLESLVPQSPGPKACPLQVLEPEPQADQKDKGGLPINAEIPEGAYLLVLYSSSQGEIVVVFPNKMCCSSFVAPGRFDLFGPESDIKLQKSNVIKQAKLAVLVGGRPFKLDQKVIPEGEAFKKIKADNEEELRLFKSELDEFAADQGYNYKIVNLQPAVRPVIRISPGTPMGIEKNKSKKPSMVLGTQGIKEEGDLKKK